MTTEVAPNPTKPAGMRRLRTLTLVFSGGRIQSHGIWVLDRKPYLIGRDPGEGPRNIALEGDGKASRVHAEVRHDRGEDHYCVVDRGSKNGVFVGGQKVETARLAHGSVIRIGGSLLVHADVEVPAGLSVAGAQHGVALGRAVAEAAADLAAPTELPILIVGPTGAGKELMAHRIHQQSGRKGELVAVNCATFSRELIGSELFGHAAGAFSGAQGSRTGLFARAKGGTLFLDEIAELPLDQQPALLRALQERKVRPVGSDVEIDVDVRIMAATHQRLEDMVQAGLFRSDLLARLAGFVIELPPLSQRREEVLRLFGRFFASDKPIALETAEALLLHAWPQNVRELLHAAERGRLYVAQADRLETTALPPSIRNPPKTVEAAPPVRLEEEPTKEVLEQMLIEHGGNVAEISRLTGKHRQQVYRWLDKHGLTLDAYRPPKDEAAKD